MLNDIQKQFHWVSHQMNLEEKKRFIHDIILIETETLECLWVGCNQCLEMNSRVVPFSNW